MRVFSATVTGLILLILSPVRATININVDAVQQTFVFLYDSDATGAVDKSKPLGTGFIVALPLKSDPAHAHWVLVTARHIVDSEWAKCGSKNREIIYARVNEKNYVKGSSDPGIGFVPVKLIAEGQPIWRHHGRDDVDAAVIPFAIDESKYEIQPIPVELFPTDEEIASQSIGDPAMSAGLIPGLEGNLRNYPIFKFGQISNIPPENIKTSCGPGRPLFSVNVWLIAANLVPGNSGSPIFHVPLGGSGISIGGTRPMILGVQSISFLGADIAGMTPIKFVFEILEGLGLPDVLLRRGPAPDTKPAQ
jgi:hypothetical protein